MTRLPGWAALLIVFVLGCVASALLWLFWTPRCNEACSQNVALGMQAFTGLLPLVCIAVTATIVALPTNPRVKAALGAAGLAVLVIGAVLLTRAAG